MLFAKGLFTKTQSIHSQYFQFFLASPLACRALSRKRTSRLQAWKSTAMNLVDRTSSKLIHKHPLTAGRLGAAGVTFGLPLVVYLSTFLCNDVSGCPAPALLHPESLTLEKLRAQTPWPENGIRGLFDVKVTGWVVAYHGLLLAMQLLLPGVEATGTELSSGGRLKYKFNSSNPPVLIFPD